MAAGETALAAGVVGAVLLEVGEAVIAGAALTDRCWPPEALGRDGPYTGADASTGKSPGWSFAVDPAVEIGDL